MISGQWFYKRFLRFVEELHKNYPKFQENWGTNPILTNLVGVHPRNIHTQSEANLSIGLREVKNLILHSDIWLNIVNMHAI